jgi:O-antigen ligase
LQQLVKLKTRLPIIFLLILIFGLYLHEFSKALLSMAMIGLTLSVFIANKPSQVLKSFISNKALLVFAAGFVVLLISYFNSENTTYYFSRLQIKLPLLLLPVAFAGLQLSRQDYQRLLAFYILLTSVVACVTFGNYLINYDLINESYLQSKVMPTMINHVRFSIMMAMACYISYYLFKEKFMLRFSWEKSMYIGIGVLLFIFIHIYSVRSGLLAIYGIIVAELIIYLVKSKSYWKPALLMGVLGLTLVVSINLTPTLRNKWINTKADISTYLTKGYPNYSSLTTRFISYDAAVSIFKQNIWLGCGLGDIKTESDHYFKTYYPEIDIPILPHNQFLFCLAATGIVGLLLFCITFFFPLFYKRNWKNDVLLMQFVVLFLSFQTEPMLETQLGIAYAIIFILLPLTQKENTEIISA